MLLDKKMKGRKGCFLGVQLIVSKALVDEGSRPAVWVADWDRESGGSFFDSFIGRISNETEFYLWIQ